MEDPYCGFVPSAGLYYEIGHGMKNIWSSKNEMKIPIDLPIYMISGEDDVVSRRTKTVKLLIKRYKKLGIKDLKYKFYPGARHDLFNEIKETREEVIMDIIDWLDSHL